MQNKIAPTNAEVSRFDKMQQRGCVPCWLESKLAGRKYIVEPGDIHHADQANAVGHHRNTYLCCPWHHRGVPKGLFSNAQMRRAMGPSMAKTPERYRARYGDERAMLEYQASMLLKLPHELETG